MHSSFQRVLGVVGVNNTPKMALVYVYLKKEFPLKFGAFEIFKAGTVDFLLPPQPFHNKTMTQSF